MAEESITNYWIYAPGEHARLWGEFSKLGIMCIGWDKLGNLTRYNSRDEIAQKLKENYGDESSRIHDSWACYNFVNVLKQGDIIIPKKGQKIYLGYGIVESNYFYDEKRSEYKNVRKVKWIKKGEWNSQDIIVPKTLTKISQDYVNRVKDIIGISLENGNGKKKLTLAKNTILFGPPGTGKTFNTKEHAVRLIEGE